MRKQKVLCPDNDWSCPYYKSGECGIEDPVNECEQFAIYWDENDNYALDEPRTAFED